jgi:hypothetical protein
MMMVVIVVLVVVVVVVGVVLKGRWNMLLRGFEWGRYFCGV